NPVRADKERMRNVETERLRRLEVDRQLEPRGPLHWQITRLGSLENLVDKSGRAMEDIVVAGHISHQPPRLDMLMVGVNGRKAVLNHKLGDERALACQKR